MFPPRQQSRFDPDDAIRSTDDDAAASRLSAITQGYLSDPYTTLLYRPRSNPGGPGVPVPGPGPGSSRKPPLINVGTHHRTVAIDILVERFLESAGEGAQIVSLGAGSDSRFWRLRAAGKEVRYVELDFPHLTSLKAQRISRSPKLCSALSQSPPVSVPVPAPASTPAPTASMGPPPPVAKGYTIHQGGTALHSARYTLLPLDLRSSPTASLEQTLLPHLDRSKPVLFLAECVFCYMLPCTSEEILGWFGKTFERVAGVVYEMCGLTDTFGQVMRRNLAARHLSLPGSEPFPDVASQAARFVSSALGPGSFDESGAKSLWTIRGEVIDPSEITRISRLEMLDEIEELRLVLSHYCVAWGSKGLSQVHL